MLQHVSQAIDKNTAQTAANAKAVVAAIDRNTAMVQAVFGGLLVTNALLEKIEGHLSDEKLEGPPSPTGAITFTYKGKTEMGLQFDIELPEFEDAHAAAAEDVTHGELILTYDGVDQPMIQTTVTHDPVNGAVGQETIIDHVVPEGIMLGARFDFRDDDGNVSGTPVVMTPFLTDHNVPPPAPKGGLGFTFKGVVPD